MSRSLKKGPFVDGSLLKKVEAAQASRDKRPQQHDHARDGRIHFCSAQRSRTRTGAYY